MKPNYPIKRITEGAATKYKPLCQRVRMLRIEKQLTQEQFADILGITRVNLNAIERGNHAPSIDTLKIIKAKFRVSYDWLIDGN